MINIHVLFCYYATKRQISTQQIRENIFCKKAHQFSIVLPSKFQIRAIANLYYLHEDLLFPALVLRVIFPELLTSCQLYYSDVTTLFDLYIIFELFLMFEYINYYNILV